MLLIFALDWYRYVTTYGAVAPLLRNPAIPVTVKINQ